MALELDVQAIWPGPAPRLECFRLWTQLALERGGANMTLRQAVCIRIEDLIGASLLNESYRHKAGPTNVLAFAYEPIHPTISGEADHMADLMICGPLVWSEALLGRKKVREHWALLTVHGVLHTLGFDHQLDEDERKMTRLENDILAELNMSPPHPFAACRSTHSAVSPAGARKAEMKNPRLQGALE